jgi:hypothetical protein
VTHFRSWVKRQKRLKVTEASGSQGTPVEDRDDSELPVLLTVSVAHICPLLLLVTHLLHGLLEGVQQVGQVAAVGPGACCGLSQGLWAEQGVVRGQAWDTGDRQVVKAHPVYGQEPRTHTGLELGVDVMQCVKRLVQNVSQGWVSHIFQDVQCQGQLSLDGHRALPHLSTETDW